MFTEKDVISCYTDQNALDDGTLVAIGKADRVTRTVWESLVERAPSGSKPPNTWPVDLMGWFGAENITKLDAQKLLAKYGAEEGQKQLNRIIGDRKALALTRALIGTHRHAAKRVYDENTDGGIYKLYVTLTADGKLKQLDKDSPEGRGEHGGMLIFWLLPNECDGITLMFPEDY